jgi:hypothetical protein
VGDTWEKPCTVEVRGSGQAGEILGHYAGTLTVDPDGGLWRRTDAAMPRYVDESDAVVALARFLKLWSRRRAPNSYAHLLEFIRCFGQLAIDEHYYPRDPCWLDSNAGSRIDKREDGWTDMHERRLIREPVMGYAYYAKLLTATVKTAARGARGNGPTPNDWRVLQNHARWASDAERSVGGFWYTPSAIDVEKPNAEGGHAAACAIATWWNGVRGVTTEHGELWGAFGRQLRARVDAPSQPHCPWCGRVIQRARMPRSKQNYTCGRVVCRRKVDAERKQRARASRMT